jgi:alkylation response protein AidB-like acyl-CoA dehydrogenase
MQAVEALVAGGDVTLQASMLKLKAARLARQVTDRYLRSSRLEAYSTHIDVAKKYRIVFVHSCSCG